MTLGARWNTPWAERPWLQPLPPVGTQNVFPGTGSDDTISGTNNTDTFNMQAGGDDTVAGRGSDDIFNFGAALTADDAIDGGSGNDIVNLAGNYSGANAVKFDPGTLSNVETLHLAGGDFTLTTADLNIAAGKTVTVDATALSGTRTLIFDGSAETNGIFAFVADAVTASLTGGAQKDIFSFGAHFSANNHIDGGGGGDTLSLDGDYSAGLVFGFDTIRNIEAISVATGHDYFLILDNANVLVNQSLTVDGHLLGASDTLTVDGSAEMSSPLVLIGGAGSDTLVGGAAADTIHVRNDDVFAGAGDDTIVVDDGFTSFEVDGGSGDDTLSLDGDTTLHLGVLGPEIIDIERIALADGHNYVISIGDNEMIVAGHTLTVDAHLLGSAHSISFSAPAVSDGRLRLLGGTGEDAFGIGQSGFDVVKAGAGDDIVQVGQVLTENVRIDGGLGNDVVTMNGDYSDRLGLLGRTLRNVEVVTLAAGHTYNLATADGNVADGLTMSIDGHLLGVADRLIFDGSRESNGILDVTGGAGNDRITGGSFDDLIHTGDGTNFVDLKLPGTETVVGGSGADTFDFGASFDNGDFLQAGGGTDTILLDGNYATGTFNLPDVEIVKLAFGNSYRLSATAGMTVQGQHLGPGDILTFDGTGGPFTATGGFGDDDIATGASADTLKGGVGADTLEGGGASDHLTGGAGGDTFVYSLASDSTSNTYDVIDDLNLSGDLLDIEGVVTGINTALTTGALSDSSQLTFDAFMTNAMAGHLTVNHAILFTPDDGTLAGHTFLVVDMNLSDGYQTGADLVIEVPGLTGTLSTGDFI